MLGLKLIHVSTRGHWCHRILQVLIVDPFNIEIAAFRISILHIHTDEMQKPGIHYDQFHTWYLAPKEASNL